MKKLLLSLGYLALVCFIFICGCTSQPTLSQINETKIPESSSPTLTSIVTPSGTMGSMSSNLADQNQYFDEIIMNCNSFTPWMCNCSGFLLLIPPDEVDIATHENFENIQYRVSLDGLYKNTDISNIQSFIDDFNALSSTIQFSKNIETKKEARIQITYYPPSSMNIISNQLDPDYTRGYHYIFKNSQTPEIMSICVGITENESINEAWVGNAVKIYVNSELTGEQRDHYTRRSLLYVLGFRGSTSDYPESIFYSGENSNIHLSSNDKTLIREVYGPRFIRLLEDSCWKIR